ncbi:MAG TPA: hypothetical protein VH475_28320 [Tepidisphaeraceae bacterium]|jgi:hypothetical protein
MEPTTLKELSRDAIPRALEKAERYRFLNDPLGAESICLDILAVDPTNQRALVTLLLAMTDRFGHAYRMTDMQPAEVVARLDGDYERAYYAGIVAERQAMAILDRKTPESAFLAHDLLCDAMIHFEEAENLRPPGNDDALLRWNTCARMMNSAGVHPREYEPAEHPLE